MSDIKEAVDRLDAAWGYLAANLKKPEIAAIQILIAAASKQPEKLSVAEFMDRVNLGGRPIIPLRIAEEFPNGLIIVGNK